jgi:hypothetical protein
LRLGTEGYSPAVLRKATRQASNSASFREASADLDALLQVRISPSHLGKLARRIGAEWVLARDADVAAFKGDKLPRAYAEAAPAASVMIDGGTINTRADDKPRGVHEEGWREYKSACCLSLSSQLSSEDPQPEPPSKFLDPVKAARLAAEMKARRGGGKGPPERKAQDPAVGGGGGAGAAPKQGGQGRGRKGRGHTPLFVLWGLFVLRGLFAFWWQPLPRWGHPEHPRYPAWATHWRVPHSRHFLPRSDGSG